MWDEVRTIELNVCGGKNVINNFVYQESVLITNFVIAYNE